MLHCNIDQGTFPVVRGLSSQTLYWSITMLTPEQVLAAHKANIETLYGLTNKAFDSLGKLVELNMSVAKTALSDSASQAQAALAVKDVQELLALQSSLFLPLADKAAAYSRNLYDIASGVSAEFSGAAEAQVADAQKQFTAFVEAAAKNAPAGSEAAVAAVKSAVSAASTALESVQKAVKQATDVAEANLAAVTSTATSAAKTATKKR